eukprot:3624244-Lingulodinium_polyedra.AAC.1
MVTCSRQTSKPYLARVGPDERHWEPAAPPLPPPPWRHPCQITRQTQWKTNDHRPKLHPER